MNEQLTPPARTLPRRLGFWSATAVVVGMTIGSGIFRTPAVVAARAPNPRAVLALWLVGGIVSLCGALSVAELAAALPESGGFYVFLREGWGRPAAFAFGWSQLVLVRASIIGGISIVFGEYLLRSAGFDPVSHPLSAHVAAATAVAIAAGANIRAARLGAAIVNASTAAKTLALTVLILAVFALGGRHGGSAAHLSASSGEGVSVGALGLALISVLFTYDGFADVSMIGGEIRDPQRVLPRAILLGTAAIVGIYLLANLAYLYLWPVEQMARSPLVAADTMFALFGGAGARLVSALVALSTFSTLMAVMLATPRIFFAQARDGLIFRWLGAVHSKYQTPYAAIAVAAALGMVFTFSQTFERLADTAVLALWPFYALSVAALYRLRRTSPDLPRPYRVVGYPIVPAVFIASVAWVVVNAAMSDPVPTLVTLGVMAAGLPVYFALFAYRPTP